jgi:serine/threonine-protein kinase HipA
MALHLVGETIDKHRANYGIETGKLVQLMRGIYVDVVDDVDATILKHAVRISRYLYPHTYLSAASATLLAPNRAYARLKSPRTRRLHIRLLILRSLTMAWENFESTSPPSAKDF